MSYGDAIKQAFSMFSNWRARKRRAKAAKRGRRMSEHLQCEETVDLLNQRLGPDTDAIMRERLRDKALDTGAKSK
jgi:hypothetical protein